MDDKNFKDLVIRKLERLEESQEDKHGKFQSSLQEMREEQIKHSYILSALGRDIPEIKKDLFEHKEGVIQNRAELKRLNASVKTQDEVIDHALKKYSSEVLPVIEHVKYMQSLPEKTADFLIKASKVTTAILILIGGIGTLIAYFA